MATKLQFYQAVADRTINEVAARSGNWQRFLDTAARLYKYPFQDQLMIFAQRPDAAACAELELWNEQFNRWVRRGTKGIALIDDSGNYPRLKYVFDMSDTEASLYRAKPVHLWELQQEHKVPVLAEIAHNYEDIDADGTLADAFRNIAKQLAEEYYNDNAREIAFAAENSVLAPVYYNDFSGALIEQADDTALSKTFTEVLTESIAYTLMARCGLDTAEYFGENAFQSVLDFNTPDMVQAIGVATADLSEQVLRDIELTVRKYERQHAAERSEQNYDRNLEADGRPYLHNAGRLSAPGHSVERTAEGGNAAAGQVRPNEEVVPQRPPENNVQPPVAVGEVVPAPAGSGGSGEPQIRADNDLADSADESAGQRERTDEVDGGDEYAEIASGGSDSERTDLRIDEPEPSPAPPQTATLSQVGTNSITETLSTSAVTLAEVDSILRDGGNDRNSYLRIAARFAKDKTPEELSAFLRREYLQGSYGRRDRESGKGYDFGNHHVCAWFDKDGISLAIGVTAKNNIHKVTIPWETAAVRVNELMLAGEYADRPTFEDALDNERLELAGKLWFFYRDDMRFMPEEWNAEKGGYPEDEALIKSLLDDPDERQGILDRLEADVNQFNYDEHDRVWYDNNLLLNNMCESMLPTAIFPNGEYQYKRDFAGFITQDEIDAYLTHDPTEHKLKTLSHYLMGDGDKDFTAYLKDSFGIYGGGTHALGGADNSYAEHSSGKGITLQRGQIGNPYTEVKLNPNQAAKRVKMLIESGQFASRTELDGIASYEKLVLVRNINNFFSNLPEEYERPFPGKTGFNSNEYHNENGERTLNFSYPHEAEWQAINDLLDNPDNVHALLARMEPIYVNTLEEDRYYNTRKTAWDNLNDWRDGAFTLFPGIENLPDPEAIVTTRFNGTRREPVSETIIDLNDSPSFGFGAEPVRGEQMSLFEEINDSPLPILPSVEEQRTVIDDALKSEAQAVETRDNEPFLDISNEDKARLYEAFADNPRSRAAANLVKEIYGDTLNMPLPQAIQKITELVEMGLLDGLGDPYNLFDAVRDELSERGYAVSGELVEGGINQFRAQVGHGEFADVADFIENEYLSEEVELSNEPDTPKTELYLQAVGDFYELTGSEAQIAAEVLGLTITPRNGEPMVGFPNSVLDDYLKRLTDAGYAVMVPEVPKEVPPYNVGDTLMYDGKLHGITRIDDYVQVENRDLDNPAKYPIFDRISIPREQFELELVSGELTIEPPQEIQPEVIATPQAGEPYKVGDNVWIDGRAFRINEISESSKEPDDLDRKFGTYGRSIELWDIALSRTYPITRSMYQAEFEYKLSLDDRNEKFLPLGEITEQAEPEVATEPITAAEPVPPPDFDAVAQTVYDRVMADDNFAYHLQFAQSRGALRSPLNTALDKIVGDMKAEEPAVYGDYFTDDITDDLFDHVYKTAWENRPQSEQAQAEPEQEQETPQFTEITDPAVIAEIDEIFPDTPNRDYVVGSRVVLDLRDRFEESGVPNAAILAGEFYVDAIDGDSVTVSATYNRDGDNTYPRWNGGSHNAKYETTLTTAEVEAHNVKPYIEKLHEEMSDNAERTDYLILRYPDGIDAGAGISHDDLALITERADKYVICAEACYLSEAEMERFNITFRKMPRDWTLLPTEVQDKIRATLPVYEQQWRENTLERMDAVTNGRARYEVRQVPDDTQNSELSYVVWDYLKDKYYTEHGEMFIFPDKQQAERCIERIMEEIREEISGYGRQKPVNFRIIDDHLGEGGAKSKFRNNILALQTLKTLEAENRNATPEEQETLSRYIGWGGLPQAFDPENNDWAKEYAELSELLTPEEFDSARASTLNAHYTSPTVIKAMWETIGRMGFDKGNILEPSMGVGNFFGLIPGAMTGSKLYGVELDSVTARIAKQLYPKANIQQTGFEKTEFSDAFFDLAIGNVPFGSYGVADKRYDKHDFSIHNYFFAKTLDKVRPGGVVAFVTSKFTMDEKNPHVRKYLAERAELLGAVRLPNNAFLKNAGTETTMDILFLQKRDRPLDVEPEWVHLGLTEDGIPVNRYFLDNPEMVCGTMGLDERMNNKYGRDDYTACLPTEGADLAEQLKTAMSYFEGEYSVTELDDLDGVDDHAIPADPNVKNYSYAVVDGAVYFRENSLMYPVDLPAATLDRIKGMIGLRGCVQELIDLQLDDYTSDSAITAKQTELNDLYDSFIAEFGLINSTANNRAFNADSAYYLLSSLEILDEDSNLERKADMFTKRTIKQKTVVTHVDTASEALAVSLGERAFVDLDYMSDLTGKDSETLLDELRGVIFLNVGSAESQEKTYVAADEYLSGNVREKLRLAEAAAQTVPSLKINVDALKAIQPKDLEAGEISVRLGATWIEPKYVQEFMYELLNTTYYNKRLYQVQYHQFTGEWQVTGKGKSQYSDISATVTYGTGRMNAYQILEDTLNLRDVRVYDRKEDADGKEHRVLNKKETMLAQQKQEIIKQAFKDWIWKDPERRQTLTKLYNEKFNSIRTREYDGSHITFSGISPEITLRPHQLNAIAHILYGGNTLLAHEVGAGKTFEMVGAAMESKRLGQCHKSLFAVPNHLTEQWAGEFLRLYPSANILVATKKDFEMRNRKKFCAKIATGDYDAVIIGHSQLEKIPMSRERQERQMREQIYEVEEGIRELKASNGERFSVKQLEKTKRSLEARLSKLLDAKKRDDVVTFEQLGCDRLYIDEAHNFKNLFLYTKMRNVAGLSTSEAAKSSDLFMKCRYLDELTDNKGVIFATGTPISNSMTEMYTMQRYLQHDRLTATGLFHFDSWASIFGETQTSIELAPEGTGYRARTRFAKFHNLPELMTVFKEVADIQTADMLNLPVPDAKFETIIVEPSELQKDMVEELSERAAAVHNREVDPQTDNMLKITTDGRKIGLDQRLINPMLPDFEGSKVNACTDKVFEIWQDTSKDRLTQLVFCDFSTPKKDGSFNVYDDIKAKLIERGIPEHELAFIHDADTETKKKELFAKVRQGKVRVLFGSTFKMGAGTNVQDRLIAIHDADCPWRPADLAQRAGRIVRQGNKNAEVQIYRYATSGTFDSYLWQTVEAKQKFIAQIMSSKSPVRSADDVDETALSYAEIKALCAGNPLIAEKMQLDNDVARLRMLKSEYKSQHYRLEDSLLKTFPQQIASVTERIAGIEKDIAAYTAEKEKYTEVTMTDGAASVSAKFPGMTINGATYIEKEPAAKALLDACKGIKGREVELPIGDYMGFKLSLSYASFGQTINLMMRGAMTYQTELGTDAFGNITRINNALDKLPERVEGAKSQLANYEKQVAAAKKELAKPFSLEADLQAKEARLALLNADLNIDTPRGTGGDGGFDVENDSENRDENGDNEEQDEAEYDDSEPEYNEPEVAYTLVNLGVAFNYPQQSERVAAYGKAKPDFLESLKNLEGKKQPTVPGNAKQPEHEI